MSVSLDIFGNTVLTGDCDVGYIQTIVSDTPTDKAIVLYFITASTIDAYNARVSRSKWLAKHVGNRKSDGTAVHVIPQHSNCPMPEHGVLFAAGVNVILRRQNTYYSLMIKDRTKSRLTSPGGCMDSGEMSAETALRELEEETRGHCTPFAQDMPGIKLQLYQLNLLAEVRLVSTYYDTEVDDRYVLYRSQLQSSPYDRWLDAGTMRFPYKGNEETEYVQFFPLYPEFLSSLDSILQNRPETVSSLHWVMTYAHLAHLLGHTKLPLHTLSLPFVKSIDMSPIRK